MRKAVLLGIAVIVGLASNWTRGDGPRHTIDFEEKTVEGMNAKDLNSASQTGENRGKKNNPLIREKTDFRDELRKSLRELKWVR